MYYYFYFQILEQNESYKFNKGKKSINFDK